MFTRKSNKYKNLRHPVSKVIPIIALTLTLLVVTSIATASAKRTTIQKNAEDYFISKYDSKNEETPDNRGEILNNLPEDQKQVLHYIDYLKVSFLEALIIVLALANTILIIKYYLKVKGEGVWMDPAQYPQVYNIVKKLSEELDIKAVPDVFLLTGDGSNNVKIACALGMRNHIAIPIDIFDICIEHGDTKTLSFLIGHELAHHHLGHRGFWYNLLAITIYVLPPLKYTIGNPMYRSAEYSADKIASKLSNDTNGKSLLVLTASGNYFKSVNFDAFIQIHSKKHDFWLTVSNFFKEHPHLSWRIKAIHKNKNGRIF